MITFTLKQLVNYNIHLGHKVKFNNVYVSHFLIGTRNKFNIINLDYSLYILKRVTFFFNVMVRQSGHLLFLVKGPWYFLNLDKYITLDSIIIHSSDFRWLGGTLSNFKELFVLERFPTCALVLDPFSYSYSIHEIIIVKMPLISIVDSNTDPININYQIPGNNDSLRSLTFYYVYIYKLLISSFYRYWRSYLKLSYIRFLTIYLNKYIN